VEINLASDVNGDAGALRALFLRAHAHLQGGRDDSGCVAIHARLGTPYAFVCIFPASRPRAGWLVVQVG